MTIPAAIALALCTFALGILVGAFALAVFSATMNSSQISHEEEQTPTPLPWYEHIPGHWEDSA